MTHYLKYITTFAFIALITCNGVAQKRLEDVLKKARQSRLAPRNLQYNLFPDKQQAPGLYLNNTQETDIPEAPVYSVGLVFDVTKRRFVNHVSTKPLSLRAIERQRSLQNLYFNRLHPSQLQWQNLSNVLPRYRFSF